jgi:hypothetical protein
MRDGVVSDHRWLWSPWSARERVVERARDRTRREWQGSAIRINSRNASWTGTAQQRTGSGKVDGAGQNQNLKNSRWRRGGRQGDFIEPRTAAWREGDAKPEEWLLVQKA